MNILAIDLGTQSIRAALVSKEGEILEVSQLEQEVDSPEVGWAQQKPEVWWNLTKKVMKNIINTSQIDINSIKGVSTCGQMHGPVGIDEEGNITTEWTQIWMDKRCENICNLIKKENDESELAKITGNPITTGWPGVKVRWIKDHQPEVYEKTKIFLVPKDFINYQLTGIVATDPSEASGTYLYDFKTNNYNEQMAKILDVDLTKFAPIYNSYDIIGNVKEDISKDIGLPKNVPVIAGGGDFIVSLLGLGLTGEGTAVDMTGTSTLFVVHKDKPIVNPLVQNLRHVIDGWIPFTMLDTGGLSMKWCKDLLSSIDKKDTSYEEMIKMAEDVPIGSEGLLFYPYMLGERRQENVLARGCFYGLTLNHKAAHIARSVMEGVALAIGKDVKNFKNLGVKIRQVYCLGGATRNKLLYKIKADVMQLPQILTEEPEASLRGCGLLAAYGLGLIKDIAQVAKLENSKTITINPNKEAADRYHIVLEEFIRMYDHLIGYWYEKK
ncbi:MAG: FGGY-family carbohydrate kinase [Candidatus Hermodarchaeota archaeon]